MTDDIIAAKVLLLIVEDDPFQLMDLEDLLADAGFDVLKASSGGAAVDLVSARGAEIKGVITDIRLGDGLDGWAVGRSARESLATMPIVYVSGDSAHEWAANGVPNSLMISKPFAPAQIITAISQLLNSAAPTA